MMRSEKPKNRLRPPTGAGRPSAGYEGFIRHSTGSILVALLWCVALLSLIIIGVLHTGRLHMTVAKNYADKIQARYLALAGIEKAKALLYQDAIERRRAGKNHTGDLYNFPGEFREVSLGRGKFSVLRRSRAEEGGQILYGISDEESRLNLNQAGPEEFAKLNVLTPDTIAAITDWKDEDNNVSPGGAEAEYYSALRPPYIPRNGPLQTVRELLMVRGISRALLLGDDINENGLLGSGEEGSPGRSGSGSLDPGLWIHLTVDGWTENVNAQGDARVNIQTSDETSLTAVPGITPQIARAIVLYRNQKRFESIADLLDVAAVQNQPPGALPNTAAQAGSGPKLINEELFLQIADSVSAENVREQPGLININTASATVLNCLAGVTLELAQAVVSYRSSNGFFQNIAGLLQVPGMTQDIFKQIAGRLTARSETFRIVGEGKINSSGVRQRMEVIVHVGARSVDTLAYREDL